MDREKYKLDGKSFNIIEDNIKKLQELFPEIVTEGKVDIDKLALLFDKARNEDTEGKLDGEERYEFTWKGKKEAMRLAQKQSTGTLRPCREESVNFDETQNLYIEGDNLEVLRALQNSYRGKVKMIYIDPPYNTGNDFVYKDDFKDNIANYKEKMNEAYKTNTNNDGRYHTNWLNMMYPRLKLARNLLTDDGVIFISIDDNEVDNLRKICDEIYGEENFINQVSIKTKPTAGASGGGEDKKLKKNIEYILCYLKRKDLFIKFNDVFEEFDLFMLIDSMKKENKSWKYTRIMISTGNKTYYKSIKDGSGEEIKIYKHENFIIKSINELINEEIKNIKNNISLYEKKKIAEKNIYIRYFNKIFRDTNAQSSIRTRVIEATDNEDNFYSIEYIPKSGKNKGNVITQYYKGKNKDLIAWLSDIAEIKGNTIIKKEKLGTLWNNFNWNNVTKEGDVKYSNGKKPVDLIKRLIKLSTYKDNNNLVLDFFAGSASTAHAVTEANVEDSGNRKFIMIQLPESLEDNFDNAVGETKKQIKDCIEFLKKIEKPVILSEIGKERIRRAGKKILEENKDKEGIEDLDIGFKVFKLDSTNLKEWDENILSNKEDRQQSFDDLKNPIKDGRTTEDLVYEIMLKYGVDLTMPIEELEILGSKVYSVGCGYLMICLEDNISLDLIEAIGNEKPNRVVLADKGLTTSDLINGEKILTELGVQDIRTI
ncbi:site-specific DNA-methyltransferase [Clostridium perfringens]|nr:site-specific DNA-methyltransferase [Clostridium perfringens]